MTAPVQAESSRWAVIRNPSQKQTSCVLTSVVGKTCKQAVAHGWLVVGAIEMTWLFAPRSFPILSEFLAA